MEIKDLTIKKIQKSLNDKEFSAGELVDEFYKNIERKNHDLNAYLSLSKEMAYAQAEEIDRSLDEGKSLTGVSAVPMAIKDNILIEGLKTTAASKALENYIASYDASVIKKLKQQKAIFLGKVNLDEFAMGSSTENSAFGVAKNPFDYQRVSGGSSGGSAASVAASLAVASLGTDTGGSIRQPASFCGVVGLKPTYGAVSRFGAIAMASSLDQIGPIAKTADDAALVFAAISGQDPFDSTSAKTDYNGELLNPDIEHIKGLKIGLPKEYFIEGLDQQTKFAMNEAIEKMKMLGCQISEISLPHTKYALSCYYIIMTAEVSANLARYDGIRYSRLDDLSKRNAKNLLDIYLKQRGQGLGEEVRRRIMLGTYVLSSGYYDAYYSKAQKVRRLIKQDFDKILDPTNPEGVDVIMTPVSPTAAFKIGEKTKDPLQMYLSDIFTIPLNLAGLPGVSIPVKKYEIGKDELPIGFQLIGRNFREADILGIGKFYEQLN